ncbi:Murein hydrolase activator NlpD [Blochmannia endosymbiont of Polyrhachis (Hedomyrma) turneri]|nr:peptidoglycan DD-metalloendopeptidase family protein [Blochmannia endosymbiont of Polyrhachis (Hedomyrma) turneri]AKC59750.1 Murein hydrolase activator NlpD [Blochmannia endosymbiont of Polyrhachis (Hedomyrma) turneri]
MSEPISFLSYYYCMMMGSFMFIWILSGCSYEHPSYENICISNIDRSIREFSLDSEDPHHRVSGDRKKLLNSSTIKYNASDSGYHHDYNYGNKGSYSSCCYVVKPGDTLFYIAWITGNNCHILAQKNNISINSVLKVGQILQVGGDNEQLNDRFFRKSMQHNQNRNFDQKCNVSFCLNSCKSGSCSDNSIDGNVNGNIHHMLNKNFINLLSSSNQDFSISSSKNIASVNKEKKVELNVVNKSRIVWTWPTYGSIISSFSSLNGGNKGIDISGKLGQPIFSVASGKVVYAGNALVGYGNLIIVKHNDDFLSTYSHNETILVSEQQYVKGGQKIATMGSSDSDVIKLYFEIRYKGKSVDPLYYLPKR